MFHLNTGNTTVHSGTKKTDVLYFLSNKIFYNDYSFKIHMMLQVIFMLFNIIFH